MTRVVRVFTADDTPRKKKAKESQLAYPPSKEQNILHFTTLFFPNTLLS